MGGTFRIRRHCPVPLPASDAEDLVPGRSAQSCAAAHDLHVTRGPEQEDFKGKHWAEFNVHQKVDSEVIGWNLLYLYLFYLCVRVWSEIVMRVLSNFSRYLEKLPFQLTSYSITSVKIIVIKVKNLIIVSWFCSDNFLTDVIKRIRWNYIIIIFYPKQVFDFDKSPFQSPESILALLKNIHQLLFQG